MAHAIPGKLVDGTQCKVVGGTHVGKSGVVRDIKTGKTGHVSITVVQANGERFKTLAKNVEVQALMKDCQATTGRAGDDHCKYYWEDFTPGWQYESPPRMLTADEIMAFARDYDPQSYHTDEEAAKSSPFGGLIASGWQTCGVAMRLMCDGYLLQTSCIGSPGLDELRWFKPVRPGDALRLHSIVLDQAPSQKNPTRGTVTFRWDVLNQKNELVCSMTGRQHYRRRTPARLKP